LHESVSVKISCVNVGPISDHDKLESLILLEILSDHSFKKVLPFLAPKTPVHISSLFSFIKKPSLFSKISNNELKYHHIYI
jgi:hypothetical protein